MTLFWKAPHKYSLTITVIVTTAITPDFPEPWERLLSSSASAQTHFMSPWHTNTHSLDAEPCASSHSFAHCALWSRCQVHTQTCSSYHQIYMLRPWLSMWHPDTADCVYVFVLHWVPSAKQSMFPKERSYQDSDTVFSAVDIVIVLNETQTFLVEDIRC